MIDRRTIRARTSLALLVACGGVAGCMPHAAAVPEFRLDPIEVGPPGSSALTAVAFMVGCWRGPDVDGVGRYEERWSPPVAGLMLGGGRSWTGARLDAWEHLAIEADDDGILLRPSPGGIPSPAVFRAVRRSASAVLFAAPDHDYPRRLEYRRRGDRLDIRVDGGDEDTSPLRWSLVRVTCD